MILKIGFTKDNIMQQIGVLFAVSFVQIFKDAIDNASKLVLKTYIDCIEKYGNIETLIINKHFKSSTSKSKHNINCKENK